MYISLLFCGAVVQYVYVSDLMINPLRIQKYIYISNTPMKQIKHFIIQLNKKPATTLSLVNENYFVEYYFYKIPYVDGVTHPMYTPTR